MKVQTFLLTILCAGASWPAAEAEEPEVHELAPLVVSSPLHDKAAETAHPVTVLSDDELRVKAGNTIGDTLSQEVGITRSSFGPGVGQPVIRGQSGARVRVLQNSLNSQDVSTLSPDHANSTEALLAERIEVLRGPATLLYGSGVIGGVVNVLDNRIPDAVPERTVQGAAEQRYDTASDQKASVFKLDGGAGAFAWHLDGFFRERNDTDIPGFAIDEPAEAEAHEADAHGEEIFNSKGFIENTDARAKSGTAGFSVIGDKAFVGVSVNYLENDYGIPPGAHGAHEDDGDAEEGPEAVRIDLKQLRYDIKSEIKDPFPLAESVRFRLGYNDYQHTELENGIAGTKYENEAVEGRVELVHGPLAFFHHGVVGMQSLSRDFSAIGEEAIVPVSEIQSHGFFAVEDVHAGDWIFEAGLRVEHQIIDPKALKSRSHTPVSASASALWNLWDSDALSLSFMRSQRAPEVQELFFDGPHLATRSFERGNPDLKEETSHGLELGYRLDRGWLRGEINLFYNWVSDYIFQANSGTFFDPATETLVARCDEDDACLPVLQATQLDAVFKGFEAELTVPVIESDYGNFDVTFFGDYVRGKIDGGGDVPRLPPLRYGVQLDYSRQAWSGNIRLTRGEKQDRPGRLETVTDDYLLLNASVNYRVGVGDAADLMFFAKGYNLLDEEIRNSTSFLRNFAPDPGRGVELGIRIDF